MPAHLYPSHEQRELAFRIVRRADMAGNCSAALADTDGIPKALGMLRTLSEQEAGVFLHTLLRAARSEQGRATREAVAMERAAR